MAKYAILSYIIQNKENQVDKKIAVIMPVYRNVYLLEHALDSLLAQTLDKEFEVVLIDDGSGDPIVFERIKRFKYQNRQYHPRIKTIVHQKIRNDGQSLARIEGIYRSSAEWICYLDADDVYHRDYLKHIDEQINNFDPNADLVVSNYHIRHRNEEDNAKLVRPAMLMDTQTLVEAVQNFKLTDSIGLSHSRELYEKTQGWPPFLLSEEDAVFGRRLVEAAIKPVFTEQIAGYRTTFSCRQGRVQRPFDSGMYMKLDIMDPLGGTGQYLDLSPALHEYFIDPSTDKDFKDKNAMRFIGTLVTVDTKI